MAIVNNFYKVCWILLIPLIAASPLDVPRIINGTTAVADNTGHQVSIRMKDLETIFGSGHVCGGSLIAPNVVLTAAHCFYDDDLEYFFSAEIYFIVMGTLNRYKKTEHTLSIDVVEIVHNNFVRSTFENDVALLLLNERVPQSNPAINVIPLNRDVIPVGTVCQVTGWGTTEKGSLSKVLMTVDVPIVDSRICSTNYGENAILDGMMCAGYMEGGKDACQGDSGGPLVSKGKLVGIVSFGDGCASPGFPGVYTSVRHHADWIEDKIANVTVTTSATPAEDTTLPKENTATLISLSNVVFLLGSLLFSTIFN